MMEGIAIFQDKLIEARWHLYPAFLGVFLFHLIVNSQISWRNDDLRFCNIPDTFDADLGYVVKKKIFFFQ